MLVLGIACGAITALPFAQLARRQSIAARTRSLAVAGHAPAAGQLRRRARPRPAMVVSTLKVLGAPRARRRQRRLAWSIGRELPVVIDLLGVSLAAGCTPYLAIEHAARYGPTRVARMLREVTMACSLGQSFDDALGELGTRVEVLRRLTDALRTTARLGSPAAPALARLAAEVRADVRRSAEARARTIPVRLCFPLVACVLPAFALLTVAPVVLGGIHG